jgi:hypothetical protein
MEYVFHLLQIMHVSTGMPIHDKVFFFFTFKNYKFSHSYHDYHLIFAGIMPYGLLHFHAVSEVVL